MSEEKYVAVSDMEAAARGTAFPFAVTALGDTKGKTLAELNAEAAKPKPVDPEALIGLECIFYEKNPEHAIPGVLMKIRGSSYGRDSPVLPWWRVCRPRPDYWYYHRSFGTVDEYREKKKQLERAGFNLLSTDDWAAFQILGPAEGRCWPEDAEC